MEDAVALVRSRDSVAVPLGPGQPAAFLHALGERESFDELTVFGALFIDLFPLFTRPGVRLSSGFFGPVERGLVQAGFDVQFVPADFRRFSAVAETIRPRVMATAAPGKSLIIQARRSCWPLNTRSPWPLMPIGSLMTKSSPTMPVMTT